jgi:hypothetical protein
MSYLIDRIEDEPIVIITYGRDFESLTEMIPILMDGIIMVASIPGGAFVINDLTHVDLILEEVILGANLAHNDISPFANPQVLGNILVTTSDLIKLAATGLNSETFGFLHLPVFNTVVEAVEYARQSIAQAE